MLCVISAEANKTGIDEEHGGIVEVDESAGYRVAIVCAKLPEPVHPFKQGDKLGIHEPED